jgi:hypothetical protein
MDPFLEWMRESPIGVAMRETPGMFPATEMAHFIGLSLLFGAMIVVDLRILGAFRQASYRSVFKLLPFAIAGFAINLVSGVFFILCNPVLYLTNPAFFAKLGVIALAGINALWFTFMENRQIVALPSEGTAPAHARIMAAGSLGMWLLVILLGRLLPTFAPVAGG